MLISQSQGSVYLPVVRIATAIRLISFNTTEGCRKFHFQQSLSFHTNPDNSRHETEVVIVLSSLIVTYTSEIRKKQVGRDWILSSEIDWIMGS